MIFQASDILLDLAANERSSSNRNSNFKVGNNMDDTRFLVDYDPNDSVSGCMYRLSFSLQLLNLLWF